MNVFDPWVITICTREEFERKSFEERLKLCLGQISFNLLVRNYTDPEVEHYYMEITTGFIYFDHDRNEVSLP